MVEPLSDADHLTKLRADAAALEGDLRLRPAEGKFTGDVRERQLRQIKASISTIEARMGE